MIITSELYERTNGTELLCEEKENWEFNAPHSFILSKQDENVIEPISIVEFQKGPIKEVGFNGVKDEDLILMVKTRMEAFQDSPFACNENQEALACLEEALSWMQARTKKREDRGVEGTSTI